MNGHDRILLGHIVVECEKIMNITSSVSYDAYMHNTMYQDALIRPLEIIGEVAGQLSSEFRDEYPQIPVAVMKGLRNVLAHQYFAVDLHSVWKIAGDDVPVLYNSIQGLF